VYTNWGINNNPSPKNKLTSEEKPLLKEERILEDESISEEDRLLIERFLNPGAARTRIAKEIKKLRLRQIDASIVTLILINLPLALFEIYNPFSLPKNHSLYFYIGWPLLSLIAVNKLLYKMIYTLKCEERDIEFPIFSLGFTFFVLLVAIKSSSLAAPYTILTMLTFGTLYYFKVKLPKISS